MVAWTRTGQTACHKLGKKLMRKSNLKELCFVERSESSTLIRLGLDLAHYGSEALDEALLTVGLL